MAGFFERGWVPATSGDFSARLDSQRMIITASGWHKGELSEAGLMLSDLDGRPLTASKRPSAETLLHAALYRGNSEIGAVLHTHSIYSTVLSRLLVDELILSDYEVLKAFSGVETHQATIRIPVFPNDQDMTRLAATVLTWASNKPSWAILLPAMACILGDTA